MVSKKKTVSLKVSESDLGAWKAEASREGKTLSRYIYDRVKGNTGNSIPLGFSNTIDELARDVTGFYEPSKGLSIMNVFNYFIVEGKNLFNDPKSKKLNDGDYVNVRLTFKQVKEVHSFLNKFVELILGKA